jgi:hypothetical protein
MPFDYISSVAIGLFLKIIPYFKRNFSAISMAAKWLMEGK